MKATLSGGPPSYLKGEVYIKVNKKTIFVTGATSGIGLLFTKECIKKGYTVYATGRNASALATLERLGAHVLQADLRQLADIDRVAAWLPEIDVAVINAGVGYFDNAFDLTDEQIARMLETNVRAPIHLAQRLAPAMCARGKGQFIFVGSQAGKVATRKASVYAASKYAITGFVNGLRMELAPYDVKVTGIYPGTIDTPFIDKADATKAYRKAMEKFLLKPEVVVAEMVKAMERPVREVNLPRIMALTSKLYTLAPATVEFVGKGFFNKK